MKQDENGEKNEKGKDIWEIDPPPPTKTKSENIWFFTAFELNCFLSFYGDNNNNMYFTQEFNVDVTISTIFKVNF